MSYLKPLTAVLVAAALLPGCMAVSHREIVERNGSAPDQPWRPGPLVAQGDAAMVAGNSKGALEYYEGAATADPALVDRKEFQKRVARAKAVKAYDLGRAEAGRAEWMSAVLLLTESVAYDPTFEPAKQTLELAKKQAAGCHVQEAARLMAQGLAEKVNDTALLMGVAGELRKALAYDPECAEAKQLLQTVMSHAGAAPAPPPGAPPGP